MNQKLARGFRDVMLDDAELRESISRTLSDLFASYEYRLIETPILESSAVFESANDSRSHENQALASTFRLVDVDGELLTLRADVTLPIARVVATRFKDVEPPYRFRYVTDVYREQESLRGLSRALSQAGIEFIGAGGIEADTEVIKIAAAALKSLDINDYTLQLGHAGVFSSVVKLAASRIDDERASERFADDLIEAAHRGDFVTLRDIVGDAKLGTELEEIFEIFCRIGGGANGLSRLLSLLENINARDEVLAPAKELQALYELLSSLDLGDRLVIDLSIMRDLSYYTGFVFEVYSPGVAAPICGGGRYDNATRNFGRELPAAGFAFSISKLEDYFKLLERGQRPLRIAVPKGTLYKDSVAMLEAAGLDTKPLKDPDRVLFLQGEGVEYIIAKPTDVAIYVASGAADCGIGGKDILVEADFPLLELVDLDFGDCSFVVAQREDEELSLAERARKQGVVRVATKYPRIAGLHFAAKGIQSEIIKLNGNIELAPLIGIADVVADITATGKTLRDNNLVVIESILDSTARFVANPAKARSDKRISKLSETLLNLSKGKNREN